MYKAETNLDIKVKANLQHSITGLKLKYFTAGTAPNNQVESNLFNLDIVCGPNSADMSLPDALTSMTLDPWYINNKVLEASISLIEVNPDGANGCPIENYEIF